MKKSFILIMSIISIISFFILLNLEDISEFNKLKNAEININSYQIKIGNEVDLNLPNETYNVLINVAQKYNADIYYSKIDYSDNKPVINKYIYTKDYNYFKKFKFINNNINNINGVFATFDTKMEEQTGFIYDFRKNDKMILKPLESAINEVSFSGDYIINLESEQKIDDFIEDLKLALTENIEKENIINKTNISGIEFYSIIAVLYIILILIVVYKILNSYKEFGIKKMLGFTNKDIWKMDILKLLLIQVTISIFINLILYIIFLNNDIVKFNYFIFKLFINIGIQLVFSFILLSIPYLLINKISISSMLKNKKPIKSIILFNNIIKIILLVIFILVASIGISDYVKIKSFYNISYQSWEKTKESMYIGAIKANNYEEFQSEEFNLKLKELYIFLNNKGGILSDFNEYRDEVIEGNKEADVPEPLKSVAWINPNYLSENIIYDINKNIIEVSELEEDIILIIPYKYIDYENEIKEYYSYLERDIQIIWSENNQNIFSYNINVNQTKGNAVLDPVILVMTNNNSHYMEYSRVGGYTGHPFIIKDKNNGNPYNYIIDKAKELDISDNLINIHYFYDEVAYNIYQLNQQIILVLFGVLLCGFIIILIILQNTYNFFIQNKHLLAINTFIGYKYYDKYRKYYNNLIFSWIIVITILFICKLISLNVIWEICFIAFGIEIIISLVSLKSIQNKNVVNVIKRR